MTFPRLFIILFCVKTLVKSRKGLKGAEAFAQKMFKKKIDLENFTKFSKKKL